MLPNNDLKLAYKNFGTNNKKVKMTPLTLTTIKLYNLNNSAIYLTRDKFNIEYNCIYGSLTIIYFYLIYIYIYWNLRQLRRRDMSRGFLKYCSIDF